MRYLKKFNEMLDPMGNWNPSQLNDKHEDEEPIKGVNYQVKNDPAYRYGRSFEDDPDEVCTGCDCIPCQCTGEEYDEDEDLKEGLDDHFRDVRVNSYLKIARDKYKGKSSDDIVDTIDKGNPDLRFMDDKEKDLFRNSWDKENTKGTFKYFMSLSNDELKDYQNNFSHHDFESPAEHSPEFVAWKKACEIKKCFDKEPFYRSRKESEFPSRY
jgi:hypothetical protein